MAKRTAVNADNSQEPDFQSALNGRFHGLLRREQFHALQATLSGRPAGWFIYITDEPPPARPSTPEEFRDFVQTLFERLRRESPNSCSFIYADKLSQPSLIKIFNPKTLIACGTGHTAPRPAWIFSKMQPAALPIEAAPRSPWKRFRLF